MKIVLNQEDIKVLVKLALQVAVIDDDVEITSMEFINSYYDLTMEVELKDEAYGIGVPLTFNITCSVVEATDVPAYTSEESESKVL